MSSTFLTNKLSLAQKELSAFKFEIKEGQEQRVLGPESKDNETRELLAKAKRWEGKQKFKLPEKQSLSFFQWLGVVEAPAQSNVYFLKEVQMGRKRLSKTTDLRSSYRAICSVGFYKSFPDAQSLVEITIDDDENYITTRKQQNFYECTPLKKDVSYKLCDDLSRICFAVQGHLSHGNTLSQADQKLIKEIANLLECSISLIVRLSQIPLCLSVLTNRAVDTVDIFNLYICDQTNTHLRDGSNLIKTFSQWKEAYNHFLNIYSKLPKSGLTTRSGIGAVGTQIAEEVRLWNVYGSNNSSASEDCLSSSAIATEKAARIVTGSFSFKHISEKFETVLGLSVVLKNISAESYRILHSSSGSFGTVYRIKLSKCFKTKCENVLTANGTAKTIEWALDEVAVKVATQDPRAKENAICIRKRVAREIRIWSMMKHENIVPLLGLWSGFASFIGKVEYHVPIAPWMEEDLARYVRKDIGKYHRLSLLRDITSALQYMHNRTPAVIHGDLRADNVLVKDGHAYLCDFGVSKLNDGILGFSSKPHGNMRWLPPERIANPLLEPTSSGDMYSFGSVMLEVLTRRCPWPDLSDYDVIKRRLDDKYAISPCPQEGLVDGPIQVLIENCWSFGHDFRPTSSVMFSEISDLMKEPQLEPQYQ